MKEHKLLSLCLVSRAYYNKLSGIDIERYLSPVGLLIYKQIDDYYKLDIQANRADIDIIIQKCERSNPNHIELIKEVFDKVDLDVSQVNVFKEFVDYILNSIQTKLADATFSNKPKLVESLCEKYIQYANLDTSSDPILNNVSAASLREHADESNRIALSPTALNTKIGKGVQRGHHIVIFARPETGKSSFVIQNMAAMAKAGHKVLYLGNEDPISDIITRTHCIALRSTGARIAKHPTEKIDRLLRQRGYENIYFKALTPGTIPEIENLVKDIAPDVVIVEQVRNLDMKLEGMTQTLDSAVNAMRLLAKKYNLLAISVTQAGASAHNKLILDMVDVEYSNTGVSAQADLMIGIGTDGQYDEAGQRCISVMKNKINGWHGSMTTQFNKYIGEYKEFNNE